MTFFPALRAETIVITALRSYTSEFFTELRDRADHLKNDSACQNQPCAHANWLSCILQSISKEMNFIMFPREFKF